MRTRLLRKQSSLAILVEQERETCESGSRPPSEADQSTEGDPREVDEDLEEALEPEDLDLQEEEVSLDEKGDNDSEGGDTDEPLSSEDENEPLAVSLGPALNKRTFSSFVREGQTRATEVEPPVRLSRRLMSMKKRGKVLPLVDLTEEFEFYAGDFLTVRGEEDDFYVCRVLEDVPESATNFNVAWFNRVEGNVYEVRLKLFFIMFLHLNCFNSLAEVC